MITLSIILAIWCIISTYRLYKIAKKNNDMFNPYEGTLLDTIGFYLGWGILVVWIMYLCIKYLP